MKKILFALAFLVSLLLSVTSCNDPIQIGSELLEQDEANLKFTDTLSLRTRTVKEDSVLTYTIDSQFDVFPCGHFVDPIFGTLQAQIYAQLKEASLDPPAFTSPELDSVVLTLAYDTTNFNGIFEEPHLLEVRRLTEDLNNENEFYSSQNFATEMDVLGSLNFTPQPLVKSGFTSVIGGDTVQANFISIRLDDALGMEMLNDAWYEEGAFIEMFKGIQLKVANSTATRGLMSINMTSTYTRLRLYYRNITSVPDTVATVYDFAVTGTTSPRHVSLDHDFSGATVESFIDDPVKGEDMVFLQSMSGPNVEIDIPYLSDLGDILINKAELEFYVAELAGGEPDIFQPITQLALVVKDSEGKFLVIEDFARNTFAFGGRLEEETINGTTLNKYTLNLAAYLNSQLVGGTSGNIKLFLRAIPKQETTKRVVLYGAGHSQYPAKLKITYTDLNE